MYEQMSFTWAQYEPYAILYCIDEMDWPCHDCGKPVRIYDAIMNVRHHGVYCEECEPAAMERENNFWQEFGAKTSS